MPKIPCRVESGPEGGRRGMQKCLRGKGGDFFQRKKVPSLPPAPPSLPQKPLTGRTGSWRESRGKKDWMTRQAEMEKMWPFRLQAVFPSNRACRPSYGAPHTAPGTNMGHGGAGAAQTPPPCSLAALDPARMPGNGRHPTAIPQSASGSLPRQRPPKKRQRGRSPRRRPAPLQNRAQHGQPMLPSAAGGMTAKRRRTTGPRRRTWAWRTGCCPHGPGCRHGRAAGCWSPSHAPRA